MPVEAWTDPRHVRGFAGERAALAWLTARGWRVEAHRFRAGRHDIDLIVRRDRLVAFVEVKTRGGEGFGHGSEAVGWKKRRALAWAAQVWIARHGRAGDVYRFDLVTVRLARDRPITLDVVEDAWRVAG